MPRIEACLLDIDGTLVDSNDFHVLAWREAFASEGHDIAPEVIRRQIGKGADMLIPALLPDASEAEQERIAARHGEVFKRRLMPQVQPLPGASALVRSLHDAGVKVVLASSSSQEEVDHYAGLLGVDDHIAATTSSDDVEHTKPAGDVFAAALQKVAPVQAAGCVVVGDTPYDVEAARKCGVPTIALRTGGFDEGWLRESGAVSICDDPASLLGTLQASGFELPRG